MWLATIVCFCCTVHRVVLYLYVYHAFVRIRQNHMDSLHLVVCDFPCIFQPLSPRNGSFWGRGVEESFIVISDYEINPSVLRTPPLYFAAQNTPQCCGTRQGERVILGLLLLQPMFSTPLFFNPSVTACHLPYMSSPHRGGG